MQIFQIVGPMACRPESSHRNIQIKTSFFLAAAAAAEATRGVLGRPLPYLDFELDLVSDGFQWKKHGSQFRMVFACPTSQSRGSILLFSSKARNPFLKVRRLKRL